MESVIAAVVTGVMTLVGVLVSNSRSQAVIEVKLDALAATWVLPEEEGAPELPTHQMLTTHGSLVPIYTYDGEVIRWYVFVDSDTEIQYLVNDRGGCCVRLDSYGSVMGAL